MLWILITYLLKRPLLSENRRATRVATWTATCFPRNSNINFLFNFFLRKLLNYFFVLLLRLCIVILLLMMESLFKIRLFLHIRCIQIRFLYIWEHVVEFQSPLFIIRAQPLEPLGNTINIPNFETVISFICAFRDLGVGIILFIISLERETYASLCCL